MNYYVIRDLLTRKWQIIKADTRQVVDEFDSLEAAKKVANTMNAIEQTRGSLLTL